MIAEDDYKFLKLRDAVTCLNQKVNLIGVVREFGFPKKSEGSDYTLSIKLVDESYPEPGIAVNFFAESIRSLPLIGSPGDIIQLSHVMMKIYNDNVCALFLKKSSAFALHKGVDGKDFVPYQISSKFSSRVLDKKFIENLRKWLVTFRPRTDLDDLQLLSDIKDGEQLSLVGKILHKFEVANDEWIIFLWDGTDAPLVSIQKKLVDEKDNPLRRQLEPDPLPRDVLCTFPTVGTILRVILDEDNKNFGLGFLRTDQWVNFVDIVCEVHDGLWRGVLMPFTKFCYMPKNDSYVLTCQSCYDERLSSKEGRIPWWCFRSPFSEVTAVDPINEMFVSLMDVITYPKVIGKFKCLVRVVAVFPWPVEHFLSPLGIYRVRLTLEDPTARIHAFLYAEDGDKFFDGHPPTEVLRRRMNKLLGVDENIVLKGDEYSVRNPPCIICCLKSYYLDKNDGWGTRQYRIFGTTLLGR